MDVADSSERLKRTMRIFLDADERDRDDYVLFSFTGKEGALFVSAILLLSLMAESKEIGQECAEIFCGDCPTCTEFLDQAQKLLDKWDEVGQQQWGGGEAVG